MATGGSPPEATSLRVPWLFIAVLAFVMAVTLLCLFALIGFTLFVPEPSAFQEDMVETFDDLVKAGFAAVVGLAVGKVIP
jgi:hypothetical protein